MFLFHRPPLPITPISPSVVHIYTPSVIATDRPANVIKTDSESKLDLNAGVFKEDKYI